MWWGTPQHVHKAEAAEAEKMAAAVPSLGAVPMDLDVKGEGLPGPHELHEGLRSLLESKECWGCDIVFIAGEERIEAHAVMHLELCQEVVLAASSGSFCTFLRQNPALGLSMSAVDSPKEMEDLFSVQQTQRPENENPSVGQGQATNKAEPVAVAETAAETPEQKEVSLDSAKTEPQELSTAPTETAEPLEVTQAPEEQKQIPEENVEREKDGKEADKELQKMQIRVNGLSSAEALHIILDYIYKGFGGADWNYNATNAQVNKDVLRLARSFGFSHLHEHAARWLATGLTTENVLERLVTCEEFGLGLLREKINERLALKPAELMLVCSSPEITKHPRILQDLLVQVASLQDKPPKEEVQAEETDKKEVEAEKDDENQDAENKENKHENRQEKPEKQSKKEKQDKHKPTKAEKLAKQARA